jgi:hypothetical protein
MHVQAGLRAGSSEFPHDNPRLDACTMWLTLEPAELAPAPDHSTELTAREAPTPVAPTEVAPTEVAPSEVAPTEVAPSEVAAPSPPAEAGPYAKLVAAVQDVARAGGASDVEALSSLLEGVAPASLSAAVRDALVAGAILEPHGVDVALTPAFAATVGAWRAVLRQERADLSACGESTLDTFAADLLAHFLGAPHRRAEIRRDLRRRGVAAFGVALTRS